MRRLFLVAALSIGCAGGESAMLQRSADGTGGASGASGGGKGGAAASTSASGSSGGAGGQEEGTGGSAGQGGAEAGSGGAGGDGGQGGTGGAPLDPGPTILVSGLSLPYLLRCDGASLYWVSGGSGDVMRANVDGSGLSTLAAGAVPEASGAQFDGSSVVYVVPGLHGRIVRVPLAGGAPDIIAEVPGVRGVAVHAGTVYWTTTSEISTMAGPVFSTTYSLESIAVDDSGIYFLESRNGCWHVPHGGTTPRRIGEAGSAAQSALRLDATHAIWGTSNALVRAPKGIGFLETIAPVAAYSIDTAPGIYVWSGSSVYAQRDGAPHRAIAPTNGIGTVALCGGYMYWTSLLDGIIARAVP